MFFYNENVIQIGNFDTINYMDDNKIVIKFTSFLLIINGTNLSISGLNEREIYIVGKIIRIDFNYVK